MLDGIIKYIPSPETKSFEFTNTITGQKSTRFPSRKDNLCALAFKVVNDKDKGLVTFFRVYSGIMKNRHKLRNVNLGEVERIQTLLRVKADETQLLNEISVGDIGAITGLKNVRSGDTLIDEIDNDKIILTGV